jgi:hypothetical protein
LIIGQIKFTADQRGQMNNRQERISEWRFRCNALSEPRWVEKLSIFADRLREIAERFPTCFIELPLNYEPRRFPDEIGSETRRDRHDSCFGYDDEIGHRNFDVVDRHELTSFLCEFEFLQICCRRDLANPRFALADITFRIAGSGRYRFSFERRMQIARIPLDRSHEVELPPTFARESLFDELLYSSLRNSEQVREIDRPAFRHAHACPTAERGSRRLPFADRPNARDPS